MSDFDPTVTFPPDKATDGFDNVGEGLVTSDYLLQNYLDAAANCQESHPTWTATAEDSLQFSWKR